MQYVEEAGIYLPDGEQHFAGKNKKTGKPVCLDYQADRLKAAYAHVTDFTLAVDVGAHVGLLTRELAKRFGLVYAFEPHPANYECLQANTAHLPNVVALPFALGRAQCTAGLEFESTGNSGDRQLVPGGVSVNVAPLDDVDLHACGLIKIDVQGYELEVLEGARNTLCAFSPVVLVEIEPPEKLRRTYYRKTDAPARWLADFQAREVDRVGEDRIYAFGPDGAWPYMKYAERGAYHWQRYESGKTKEVVDRVVAYVKARGPESVLDVGCGDGLFTVLLGRAGVPEVIGLDPNATAVALARERGADAVHGTIYQAAALVPKFERGVYLRKNRYRFDAVCLFDVFEHLHKQDLAFTILSGLTDTLYVLNPDPDGSRWHVKEFTRDELVAYVTARGWRVVHEARFPQKTFLHLEKVRP
jgi:FkbM family methyltransferase